ncbi:MAG: right-handed parallel beta-helix repeat-containing protein, partial [Candidatus Binatia bacterium]
EHHDRAAARLGVGRNGGASAQEIAVITVRVIAILVLLTTLGVADVAVAANLRCGMVLGEQAVLDRDLVCDGPGLIVRNPRTVLQLNGHTILSRRTCAEGAAPAGIVVEPTADGAQIFGPGLIRGFVNGIAVTTASRVQLRDLRVTDSCTNGILVAGGDDARVDGVTLHRNGLEGDEGTGIRAEHVDRFTLEASEVFGNGHGDRVGAVDLRDCTHCRVAQNRMLGNRAAGLRLDLDSHDAAVEKNVALDNAFADLVDDGNDSIFALNVFERGTGVVPPKLAPLVGRAERGVPAVAGCATVSDTVKPRETVTVTCPQDPQLRGLRNSVVGYRLLFMDRPFGGACAGSEIKAAHSGGGGSLTCTNPSPIWLLALEVTCCLN